MTTKHQAISKTMPIARDADGWKVFDRHGSPLTKGLSTCANAIKARERIIAKAAR